jgi:hypothetical protein
MTETGLTIPSFFRSVSVATDFRTKKRLKFSLGAIALGALVLSTPVLAQANADAIVQSYATGIDLCRTIVTGQTLDPIRGFAEAEVPPSDPPMRAFDLADGVIITVPVDGVAPCGVFMPDAPSATVIRAISDWARVHFTEQVTLYDATGLFENPTRNGQFNVFWCPEDGGPLQYLHLPGAEDRAPGLAAHNRVPPESCPAEETS